MTLKDTIPEQGSAVTEPEPHVVLRKKDFDELIAKLGQGVETRSTNIRVRSAIKTTSKGVPYPEGTVESNELADPGEIDVAIQRNVAGLESLIVELTRLYGKANDEGMSLWRLEEQQQLVQRAGPVAVEAGPG